MIKTLSTAALKSSSRLGVHGRACDWLLNIVSSPSNPGTWGECSSRANRLGCVYTSFDNQPASAYIIQFTELEMSIGTLKFPHDGNHTLQSIGRD